LDQVHAARGRRAAGVVADVAGDGRQRAEFVWRLGLVRGGERDEEPVVRPWRRRWRCAPLSSEQVAVGVLEPMDQAVEA
jgi:hypothetical protein